MRVSPMHPQDRATMEISQHLARLKDISERTASLRGYL